MEVDNDFTIPQHPNDFFKIQDVTPVKNFEYPIIFVLGGPGAGKATLCYKFRAVYGVSYFSMGDVLRAEACEPTTRGQILAKFVHQKPIQKIPLDIIMDILKDMLVKVVAAKRPVMIQGFPRDFEQAVRYEKEITTIRNVMYINTSSRNAARRLAERNRLAGRFEDSASVVSTRELNFAREVLPVINNLRNEDRVFEIDGNQTAPEAFTQAQEVFDFWVWGAEDRIRVRLRSAKRKHAAVSDEDVHRTLQPLELAAEKAFPSVHHYLRSERETPERKS